MRVGTAGVPPEFASYVAYPRVYELLRRRCKLVVVGDAEADPHMVFDGLSTVIRYAMVALVGCVGVLSLALGSRVEPRAIERRAMFRRSIHRQATSSSAARCRSAKRARAQ